MKAREFVEQLTELITKVEPSEFNDVINRMKIEPKLKQVATKDELSFLIHNYLMSGVEIGKILFHGKYNLQGEYFCFGEMDMDLLAYDYDNGEVILTDHDEPNFIMMKCAKNSDAFLELLSHYAKYVLYKLITPNENRQWDLNKMYTIAGGENYKKFVDFLFT